ncbi:carboxylesterase family protein [Saccharibacter sp. 17.LH.SD]|uniref:carboxylesterase/lipase family protein n=1 Tax=Saccharibacter sp. 17.LH.SD TaxID=2689393 RepID=UPI001367A1FA|nr:carboxylesterase family protein [Saccharibacter sp. 17.LH.SD]MXV44356.1 carboxylesterase family protein [Saccharibacter sp. 17.LH.SD]
MTPTSSSHSAGQESATSHPTVRITSGLVQGAHEGAVDSFKGIPFAQPPLGSLRWRAPQPVKPWSDIYQAAQFQHDAMQNPVADEAAPVGTTPSEDCLYLNVWRPAQQNDTQSSASLPVLVWIYGGGFVNGGASPPIYSGENVASQDIVFVSFNYRVGRFGTFAHPQLTQKNPDHGLFGNYGFLDQIAALRWVQQNIASFGGDPSRVTIVGESAGGMSINALLASPLAQGLFHQAVIQSGGDATLGNCTLKEVEQAGVQFASEVGISPEDPDALKKLYDLPAEKIVGDLDLKKLFSTVGGMQSYAEMFSNFRNYSPPFADGIIAQTPINAYQAGCFSRVPLLIGATSGDLGGDDGVMIRGAKDIADVYSQQNLPVYLYHFSYVARSLREEGKTLAAHASDIPYFFATVKTRLQDKLDDEDVKVSDVMHASLVNFVKNGTPTSSHISEWKPYTRNAPSIHNFSAPAS